MTVEHLAPALVDEMLARVVSARRQASEAAPERRADADDPSYWERVFEANAASLLANLTRVQITGGRAVHYRFYGRRGGDLLVRPFVARIGTDVGPVRRLLDWHAPPDAPGGGGAVGDRDVELLYRHFTHEGTPAGHFEYWLTVQELWASQRWIHSTVIVTTDQFAALTAGPDWRVERPVERVEPAVADGGNDTQIAVLVHCPLERHTVTFHRIRIGADQRIEFAESILVACGPRGYVS